MTKTERLALIRERAKAGPRLSDAAASILESLKAEDEDLGGPATFGETIAPDAIDVPAPVTVEDESEVETKIISPLMRNALD